MILNVLNEIPPHIEPFGIIQWLRHYVPLITKPYPKALPAITKWVIQKTESFQFSKEWPNIGLEFSHNMLNIFSNIDYVFP